jgi:hypothetical protein
MFSKVQKHNKKNLEHTKKKLMMIMIYIATREKIRK